MMTDTAAPNRVRVSLGAQPMLEVTTYNEAETAQVEQLIWEAMSRRTAAPDRSCAAEAANVRAGGVQRFLFDPWVAPHLAGIGAEIEAALSQTAPARPQAAAAAPPVGPVMPVISDAPAAPAAIAQAPLGQIPTIGGSAPAAGVPVIGEQTAAPMITAAGGPEPVAVPAPAAPSAPEVPLIGEGPRASVAPTPDWGPPAPAASTAEAGWQMPAALRAELSGLRRQVGELEADRQDALAIARALVAALEGRD